MSTSSSSGSGQQSSLSPWQRLPELARAFTLCDQQLERAFGRQGLSAQARAMALARLGWRLTLGEPVPPGGQELPSALLEGLSRAWRDPRVAGLHPNQRAGLLFVTGAVLALRGQDEAAAEALLEEALSLAVMTSSPSDWTPLDGPRPEPVPRLPLALRGSGRGAQSVLETGTADADEALADPSGDPVTLPARAQLEALPPGAALARPVPVSQVLDGLHAWAAVLQTCLGWPLGDMARLGRPRLERWGTASGVDSASSAVPADVSLRPFALLLAGAQDAA